MSIHGASQAVVARPGRPAFEVADVFRAHGETYRQSHTLFGDQSKVMRAIELCRTEALGGHLDVCPQGDFERPSYNSCGNRHCPKCQSLVQARWIEKRLERILPTPYFHVVFTLPAELRSLVRANRTQLFNLLFAAASSTLLELGDDPKRLGARLGVTAVLHTWTRELAFHPHVHCIVTGGGLTPAGDTWVSSGRRYLFPIKVIGALFRGKFLDGLKRLHLSTSLNYSGKAAPLAQPDAFTKLLNLLYKTDWVTYAKKPFAGPEQVFRYLGRYTHRVGISNQRIQAFDEHGVRFATKGGEYITLIPETFIGRFLEHVLPTRFTKIRHFGLHASGNVNTKLQQARSALLRSVADKASAITFAAQPAVELLSWQELLFKLTGIDPTRCPNCGRLLHRRTLQRSLKLRDTS